MRNRSEVPPTEREQRERVTNAAFFVYGAWLVASPYVLGFSWHPQAWWNALLVGIALVVLGIFRVAAPLRFAGLRSTAIILGGWMILSPFVAGYAAISAAMINAVILGALIVAAAIAPAEEPEPRPA